MRPSRLALPCLAGWLAVSAIAPARAAEVDAEDYRALKARVAAFDEFVVQNRNALQSLRGELSRLQSENNALRAQLAASRGAVTQDQLSRLATQVQEVERNRSRDKQQVLDALDRLRTAVPVPAKPAARPPAKAPAKKPAAKPAAAPARKPAAANPGGAATAPR